MANWRYKLNLNPFLDKYEKGKISIEELGKEVAEYLHKEQALMVDRSLTDQIAMLKDIADEFKKVYDQDRFDMALNDLYDWGDMEIAPYNAWPVNRMAWIRAGGIF